MWAKLLLWWYIVLVLLTLVSVLWVCAGVSTDTHYPHSAPLLMGSFQSIFVQPSSLRSTTKVQVIYNIYKFGTVFSTENLLHFRFIFIITMKSIKTQWYFNSSRYMRTECLNYRYSHDAPMPVGRLISMIGNKMQICTQRYDKRPLGVGLLVAGYDVSILRNWKDL